MKKFYQLCLVAGLFVFTFFSSFAQKGPKHHLGVTKSFSKALRAELNDSKPSHLKSQVSSQETLSLKVNFKKTENDESQLLIGEVENKQASSFYIRVNGNKLEGNIILKKEKRGFKYYSDDQGNAYVEPADINSLICIDYKTAAASTTTTSTSTASISAAVADLQSFPGARGCVMLDFDGQYVSGTPWNNGNPINAQPSGMSDAQIQETWEVVSEDFRPFHLNVTTNESVFNSYPKTMRMRCIITPTNTAAPGAGGVAYIGSFNWNDDTPCWVFVLGGKSSGEAASHEVGHTFGLGHDGRTNPAEDYYAGQGNWAPIMGVGYYENITQWSKGEYNYANNTEDDLAKISSSTWGVGFRNDDHGNSISGATPLSRSGTSVSGSGIITNQPDWDFFSLNSGSGTINLNVNTVSRDGDLDIVVRLYNSSGALIGTYNPAGLNASLSANVSAGTYYISVDGTGAGNPATDGYSDYASIGSYWISGSAPTPSVSGVAIMYKDCNFSGTAVGLPVGDYTLSALQSRGILNDDISSLKVTSGYEVQVYQDDNYGGASYIFGADDACLVDNGINDWVSSIKVRAKVSFTQTVQAENYSAMAGVQTETTTDAGGGLNVGWIDTNDWMAYNSITVPTTGTYLIEYRVASPNSGTQLSLDLNAGSIVLGAVNIPNTGGWQNWTTVSHTVTINAGTYNFGIFAQVGGWNINWWRITKTSSGARLGAPEVAMSETASSIKVFPNPVMHSLFIQSEEFLGGQVSIIGSEGLQRFNGVYSERGINVSELKPGMYTLVVRKNGKSMIKRFIKK